MVSQVLRGFARATTEEFRETCRSMLALLDNSLLAQQVHGKGVRARLARICDDLRRKYIGLLTAEEWKGTSHVASTYLTAPTLPATTPSPPAAALPSAAATALLVSSAPDGDEADYINAAGNHVFCTYEAAQIYAAVKGQRLQYNDWVKTVNCHFCKMMGHIKPRCPQWLKLSQAEKDAWNAKHRPPTRRPSRRNQGRIALCEEVSEEAPGNEASAAPAATYHAQVEDVAQVDALLAGQLLGNE